MLLQLPVNARISANHTKVHAQEKQSIKGVLLTLNPRYYFSHSSAFFSV